MHQPADSAQGAARSCGDGTAPYPFSLGRLPLEQAICSGSRYRRCQDQLGSTRALVDGSGKTVATFTYDPYGNLLSSSGTVTTPFGYAGQYTDSESGLQYLRARYYDPSTEQFVTVDPLLGTTGEPYGYAGVNPINYSDPTGFCVPDELTDQQCQELLDHLSRQAHEVRTRLRQLNQDS